LLFKDAIGSLMATRAVIFCLEKLEDAADSKSTVGDNMSVRVRPPAPSRSCWAAI